MKSTIYTCYESISQQETLEKLKKKVTDKVDFLIFTISPHENIESFGKLVKKIFQTDNFIVFHSVEHFNNATIVKNSTTLCTLKSQKNASFNYYYVDDIREEGSLFEASSYFNNNHDKFHMIFAGLCDGEIGSAIENISQKLNYLPINNIVGGVSSGIKIEDEMQTFQYIDGKVIKKGFVVLSISNVQSEIEISLGFKPYGITYKVTKAKGKRLYGVDDGKSFSYIASKMLCNLDKKQDIRHLWYSPLSILDEEDGYMLTLRTIEKITPNYVEFFAPIQKGDYFKLSFATPEDLINTDIKTANRLIEKIQKPELAFNFSCIARQYVLEDMQEQEPKVYLDTFKTNLFGFFTFGEIGPDKMYKKLKFYNETSLAVIMREI